jgi:hypothetical protein
MAPLNPAAPTFQPKVKSSAPIAVPSSPGSGEESYGLPDDPWALSNMTEVNGWAGRLAGGARSLTPSALPPGFCLGRVAAFWRLCGPAGRLRRSRSGGGPLASSPNASRALLFEGRRRGSRRSFAVPWARSHASGRAAGGSWGPGAAGSPRPRPHRCRGTCHFGSLHFPLPIGSHIALPAGSFGLCGRESRPPGRALAAATATAPPARRPALLLAR